MIPFNKPYLTGKETSYIEDAVRFGKISGNGKYTKMCHEFFETKYGFKNCLLTTSCTDALEMAAILTDIKPGDEVIIPSYTFVSTALAFVRQGAKIVFADSRSDQPNIDEEKIEALITKQTKVVVVVHYAGVACNMEKIKAITDKYKLWLIEDGAHAIDASYNSKPLGSTGHLACFSFHETKNIQSGEGGLLVINHKDFVKRAEIIWEKGTNRAAFWRGEIEKYGWVDIGSSFLPSDIIAAFLFAQLENIEKIQIRRKIIWQQYHESLKILETKNILTLPFIPQFASNNAHIFYIILKSQEVRNELINYLNQKGVNAVFHYQSLHKSPYYNEKHEGNELIWSDKYSDTLLRLPFFYELNNDEVNFICQTIKDFFL